MGRPQIDTDPSGALKLLREWQEKLPFVTQEAVTNATNARGKIGITHNTLTLILRDIFGVKSSEYATAKLITNPIPYAHETVDALRAWLQAGYSWHSAWHRLLDDCAAACVEKIEVPVGAPATLSKADAAGLFDKLGLHPLMHGAAAKLFREGNYRHAVEDGYKALEQAVRAKAKAGADIDNANLMAHVFNPDGPLLLVTPCANKYEKNEQRGVMFMFQGAAFAIRNPRAHTLEQDEAHDALDRLVFLSMLAKILDDAKVPAP